MTNAVTARGRQTALVAGLVVASVGLAACADDDLHETKPTTATKSASVTSSATTTTGAPASDVAMKMAYPNRIFGGGDNVFTQDVSKAPLDPRSAAKVKRLTGQITPHWGGVVAFNAYRYNSSLFVADASTPKQRVGFHNCQNKPDVPEEFYNGKKFFVDVPIPKNAVPSHGTDAAMAIWDPTQDKLWEFWIMKKAAKGGWEACYGGRIDEVSTNKRADFPYPYGTSASGLATPAASISVQEAKDLKIPHAINLGLIQTGIWNDVSYPANRSDGGDASPDHIPIGTRIRLDPSVDVDTLQLHPLAKAIARSAQKYGFIVSETSGAVGIGTMSGNIEAAKTGKNPWDAILAGTPDYVLMKGFPWDKMQFVQKDWGKPAGVER